MSEEMEHALEREFADVVEDGLGSLTTSQTKRPIPSSDRQHGE